MATTRKMGIITDVSGMSAGIMVNSLDFSQNVQSAQARNEYGQIVDIAGFSKSKTVNVSGYLDTAKGSVATAGSILTLQGKDWLIQSVSRTESNTDFVQVTISARTADNAEIYIVDSSSSSSDSSSSVGQ